MKKLRSLAIITAAALMLASCASTDKGTGMKNQKLSVCQGNWQLVLFMKGGIAQQIAVADITFTAQNDGNYAISGSMGENRFTGEVSSASAGAIKTESFGTTRRAASSKQLAEFESLYAQFLGGIDAFSVKSVAGENGKVLRLENSSMNSFAEFRQISIQHTMWKLIAVNDGKAVVDVKSSATVVIEKKSAAVNTGINTANLGVKVTENESKIAFSDGPMTRAAGSEADMIIESNLMKALLTADRYSISGGVLSLYSGDTLLAEFKKQDLL